MRTGEAIALFQRLYVVEKKLGELDADQRAAYRNEHARPILDQLHAWLFARISVLPNSQVGTAIDYTLNNW